MGKISEWRERLARSDEAKQRAAAGPPKESARTDIMRTTTEKLKNWGPRLFESFDGERGSR